MRAKELEEKIRELDNGDNLQVRIEHRLSRSSLEDPGDLVVERIKTPDVIRITKITYSYSSEPFRKNKHQEVKRG